jgi:hypothetical protein
MAQAADEIRQIVEQVLKSPDIAALLGTADSGPGAAGSPSSAVDSGGVFADVDSAVNAAAAAQRELISLPLETRTRMIEAMRRAVMIHSHDIEKLSKMAKVMNCSLFVKNGPCYAGLGQGGAGFTSFTIASPTGEGITRARTFTRERRCTLVDYFRII